MNLKFDEEIHLCLEDELGLKDKTNFLKDILNQQIYSQGIISSNKIAENLISSLRQNIKIKDFQTVDQNILLRACLDVFCCSVFFKSRDLKLKFHQTNFNQIANELTVSDFNKTFYLFYRKFILSHTNNEITRLQTKLNHNQWSKIFGEDTFEEDN